MSDAAPTSTRRLAGYGTVVPFDTRRHAGLGLATGAAHGWCAQLNAVPLAAAEFFRAALDYPIAFARDADGRPAALAVLGLRAGENLFVDGDGRWHAHRYVPAYVRRHPFCTADARGADGVPRRIICVEEGHLRADAPAPLVDTDGRTTAAWEPIRQLLDSMETAWQQTQALVAELERCELLAPFDALAVPRQGARMQLRGLLRIDEPRLGRLPAGTLHALQAGGQLRAIYAQLLSLENFGRLLELAQDRERERMRNDGR